ncbi:MAG TPA: hypothetical protein DC009_09355 [Porphyromonadaceae bacterium]|nr:hypothetical protein [Porphyromonadaceae bacterium]
MGKFSRMLAGRSQGGKVVAQDAVEQKILASGYVPQPRLWRRHIMAQVFQDLHAAHHCRPASEENYDCFVNRRRKGYVWRMTAGEFKSQARLWEHDPVGFAERWRWFNKSLLEKMCAELTEAEVDAKRLHEVNKKLAVLTDADPMDLHEAAKYVCDSLHAHERKSEAWVDAYKGAGAYFTMKNMILFHNCRIHLDSGKVLDRDASFEYLKKLVADPRYTGKQLFGEMMKLIRDNKFDCNAQ